MTSSYRILILTDHRTHSDQNSVYELSKALVNHPLTGRVDISSRGNPANDGFFYELSSCFLQTHRVSDDFAFQPEGEAFMKNTLKQDARQYDVLLLRLPRPIPIGFFSFLSQNFPESLIINRPESIAETGSKKFLLQVSEWCPPIQFCESLEEILAFQRHFPIVLKPIEEYGGKGIVRVENGQVLLNDGAIPLTAYREVLDQQFARGGYLAMKFMKNVGMGDKRIVVVNGKIIGASLRIPPEDSWLCNAAQGGTGIYAEVDEKEKLMARKLSDILTPKGIVIFGMDTLVDDNGSRILSEINTLSIGGIKQMAEVSNKPLVQTTADEIMHYVSDFQEKLYDQQPNQREGNSNPQVKY